VAVTRKLAERKGAGEGVRADGRRPAGQAPGGDQTKRQPDVPSSGTKASFPGTSAPPERSHEVSTSTPRDPAPGW